jgi:Fe2+ or Zn2+ uptake regulation protein
MIRRNTNQRQIVFDSLACLGHATSDDLINHINNNYSNISLATIYRNLTILLDEKLIKKVKVGDIDVYETVKEKHYHFKCRACGNIIDISPDKIPNDINSIKMIDNNDVLDLDIVFMGICHRCIKK